MSAGKKSERDEETIKQRVTVCLASTNYRWVDRMKGK